jgi:hypothetical protein
MQPAQKMKLLGVKLFMSYRAFTFSMPWREPAAW